MTTEPAERVKVTMAKTCDCAGWPSDAGLLFYSKNVRSLRGGITVVELTYQPEAICEVCGGCWSTLKVEVVQ